MNSDGFPKIETAVVVCMDECRHSDRPYIHLSAFLDQMSADGWADRDILELQARVVRRLLDDQYRDD